MFTAWHTGVFGRVKKLPKLDPLLKKMDRPAQRRMSPKQMLVVVEMLNAAHGGSDMRGNPNG